MNQIPKVIHCVWLSGDEKPQMVKDCLATWKNVMPDYEIREWGMDDVKDIDSPFLKKTIAARKWAYATDFLRVYLLYKYGGIYMDLDVVVYKPFDEFLDHGAFSSVEFNPTYFYKTLNKKNIVGLGVEAAVLGAVPNHPWIGEILGFYTDREFINDHSYCMSIIMPKVIAKISEKHGFMYAPLFQILDNDVYIYPPDVFSSVSLRSVRDTVGDLKNLGKYNKVQYACHLCANSWWDFSKKTLKERIVFGFKRLVLTVLGKERTNSLKKKFQRKGWQFN